MIHRLSPALLLLAVGMGACTTWPGVPEGLVSSVTIDGAEFAISDAAISSDCLSLVYTVSGYTPPTGTDPQRAFPPVESFTIHALEPDLSLDPVPLRGGGGGGGDTEDGRVWMRQEMLFSLATVVPEDSEVTLEVLATLNEAFGRAEPLEYKIAVVAGPGGGACSIPEAAP
jgi:hypothetical protein